tara:strand:+ start:165 stop:386 length:222 start_codon:yes stop_codon:yes gene_type:complete
MRAKRLQVLLADGWIKGSGSSSAKAGMNGGMDHLCGRLVYYDVRATLLPYALLRAHTTVSCAGDHQRLWLERL